MEHVAQCVSFGLGGDIVYCGSTTISGYGSPERPHAADFSKEGRIIPDGTPCIDVREPAGTDAGIRMSIGGPMPNPSLEPGQVNRAGKLDGIFAQAVQAEPGNMYGQLVRLHNAQMERLEPEQFGSLDYVALDIYCRLWRDIGARVGHYENGQIVWEDK